jgi:hypothetical protein
MARAGIVLNLVAILLIFVLTWVLLVLVYGFGPGGDVPVLASP